MSGFTRQLLLHHLSPNFSARVVQRMDIRTGQSGKQERHEEITVGSDSLTCVLAVNVIVPRAEPEV